MLIRSLAVWLLFMVLAMGNGWLREALLVPRLGPSRSHLLSTVVLCLLIAAGTWATIPWLDPLDPPDAFSIGSLWLVSTLAFELGFGHFMAGKSWFELLADYNVLAGRIWLLVPITVLFAPYLAAHNRGLF